MESRYNEKQEGWLKEQFRDEYHFLRDHGLSIYREEERDQGKEILEVLMAAEENEEAQTVDTAEECIVKLMPLCIQRLLEEDVDITLGELLLYGDSISYSIYTDLLKVRQHKTTPEAFQRGERGFREEVDIDLDRCLSAKPHITWGEVFSSVECARWFLALLGSEAELLLKDYRKSHPVTVDHGYWIEKILGSKTRLSVCELERFYP